LKDCLEKSLTEQTVADEREVSIATMRPTLREQRLALAVIGMLSVGFAAIAPFAAKQAVQVGSFVPTVQAIIFVTNLTTAVLLFSQFSILGLRELLLLASGYLFSALIVIPHALSYPGAFAPKGLLGSGIQATPWLYAFWHFGFSAVVLCYACLLDKNSKKLFVHNSGLPAIWISCRGRAFASVGSSNLSTFTVRLVSSFDAVASRGRCPVAIVAASMAARIADPKMM
jgi:hypothetical protein